MNRYDFQKLALVRQKDAVSLLRSGRFEGAYYLSGYVVECALKACIAKLTKRYDFPERTLVQDAYTHDLTQLVRLAKLESALRAQFAEDGEFELNWNVVKQWKEHSRYERYGQQQARDLLNGVGNRRHGVLKWLRLHW